jgi:hypothetical protein
LSEISRFVANSSRSYAKCVFVVSGRFFNSSGQLNHQRRTGSSAVLRQNLALGVPSRGFVSLPARGGFCRAEAFANSEAPVSRLHMPRLTLNRGRKRPLLGGYAALMLIFALRFFSSAPAQIRGSSVISRFLEISALAVPMGNDGGAMESPSRRPSPGEKLPVK